MSYPAGTQRKSQRRAPTRLGLSVQPGAIGHARKQQAHAEADHAHGSTSRAHRATRTRGTHRGTPTCLVRYVKRAVHAQAAQAAQTDKGPGPKVSAHQRHEHVPAETAAGIPPTVRFP
eukprot:1557277-Prymnesium_polylepis.2